VDVAVVADAVSGKDAEATSIAGSIMTCRVEVAVRPDWSVAT
jgi:hypothetical protein